MLKKKKALLFAALVVLLMGIVCAAEAPDNTITGTNDATGVVHEENIISQTDIIAQVKVDEETNTDESTAKTIQKNSQSTGNVKEEDSITVSSWDQLSRNVSALKDAKTDTTIILEDGGDYTNSGTITWQGTNMVLTIDGNGQTINGNQTQVFIINDGSSLVLKNIIIKDAKN